MGSRPFEPGCEGPSSETNPPGGLHWARLSSSPMHLDGSSTLESILTAAILAIAVPAILRRVSRWNDLARRFPATRDVGAAGVSFWHVILSVNGVSIPSRVLVTASGVRLSPTLIGALLFAEVFVPWDDLRIGSAHGQTCYRRIIQLSHTNIFPFQLHVHKALAAGNRMSNLVPLALL